MNLEGKIFANRYVLIEKIGGGGMAEVYKAQCTLLQRFVAIKILRQDFTHDFEIVQRFKFEAQSAAKLQYPNIVSIFDVGEEDGYYYIVMEYVDGITLKQTIVSKGRLSWDEALDYSIQIAAALEQAHNNRIIHRDIKPHNIIINDQGVAKVTDFGIARATNTSNTLSDAGIAIGSVHYFSPEQAKGISVDARSDIYSLGITMYEMVTGAVPFNADSPVSVALKHINDPVIPPIERVPTIPKGINQMIMKAIRKNPDMRYQSAREMIDDMYKLIRNPEIVLPDEEVQEEEIQKTKKYVVKDESVVSRPEIREGGRPRRRGIIIFVIALLLGLTLMLISFAVAPSIFGLFNKNPDSAEFTVKSYVGQKYDTVKSTFPKWLKLNVTKIFSTKPSGEIIFQDPADGQVLKQAGNPKIDMTVSKGKAPIEVPNFIGQTKDSYIATLSSLGFKFNVIEEFNQADVGYVYNTEPVVGSELTPGTPINVYVSKGVEVLPFSMPDLVGMKYSEAIKVIQNNELLVGKVVPEGTGTDDFLVSIQKPTANSLVKKGDSVNLTLDSFVLKTLTFDYSADGYEFPMVLSIDATPSDTDTVTRLVNNKAYNVSDFPVTITDIKVPIGGSTTVTIMWHNAELETFTITS